MSGLQTPADILGIANETDTTRGATTVGYNNSTVAAFLNGIAEGTNTPVSGLTGTEIVPVSSGTAIEQTTTGSIAALAVGQLVNEANVSITSGSTVLTASQYQVGVIRFNGVLSTNSTVIVPATPGIWEMFNGTTGNYTLTVVTAANGSSVVLPQTYSKRVYSDGTNVREDTASALVGSQVGFRNRIVNGNGNIAQLANAVATAGTAIYGGPNRFVAINANSAGGQFTQSQGTMSVNGVTLNAVTQTVNTVVSSLTTTNYWGGICQRITGSNVYDLLGNYATLSFYFATNVAGTYAMAIVDSTGANSYVIPFTAVAGVQQVVQKLPQFPTSLVIPNSNALGITVYIGALNTGTYQAATTGAWVTGNYFSVSGAANWGAAVGNYISATNIQLEEGFVNTPFENKPAYETWRCSLYYSQLVLPASYANLIGIATSTTAISASIQVPQSVQMISSAPTVTLVGNTAMTVAGVAGSATLTAGTLAPAAGLLPVTLTTTGLTSGTPYLWGPSVAGSLTVELLGEL